MKTWSNPDICGLEVKYTEKTPIYYFYRCSESGHSYSTSEFIKICPECNVPLILEYIEYDDGSVEYPGGGLFS